MLERREDLQLRSLYSTLSKGTDSKEQELKKDLNEDYFDSMPKEHFFEHQLLPQSIPEQGMQKNLSKKTLVTFQQLEDSETIQNTMFENELQHFLN